jgi:hypothetical protein
MSKETKKGLLAFFKKDPVEAAALQFKPVFTDIKKGHFSAAREKLALLRARSDTSSTRYATFIDVLRGKVENALSPKEEDSHPQVPPIPQDTAVNIALFLETLDEQPFRASLRGSEPKLDFLLFRKKTNLLLEKSPLSQSFLNLESDVINRANDLSPEVLGVAAGLWAQSDRSRFNNFIRRICEKFQNENRISVVDKLAKKTSSHFSEEYTPGLISAILKIKAEYAQSLAAVVEEEYKPATSLLSSHANLMSEAGNHLRYVLDISYPLPPHLPPHFENIQKALATLKQNLQIENVPVSIDGVKSVAPITETKSYASLVTLLNLMVKLGIPLEDIIDLDDADDSIPFASNSQLYNKLHAYTLDNISNNVEMILEPLISRKVAELDQAAKSLVTIEPIITYAHSEIDAGSKLPTTIEDFCDKMLLNLTAIKVFCDRYVKSDYSKLDDFIDSQIEQAFAEFDMPIGQFSSSRLYVLGKVLKLVRPEKQKSLDEAIENKIEYVLIQGNYEEASTLCEMLSEQSSSKTVELTAKTLQYLQTQRAVDKSFEVVGQLKKLADMLKPEELNIFIANQQEKILRLSSPEINNRIYIMAEALYALDQTRFNDFTQGVFGQHVEIEVTDATLAELTTIGIPESSNKEVVKKLTADLKESFDTEDNLRGITIARILISLGYKTILNDSYQDYINNNDYKMAMSYAVLLSFLNPTKYSNLTQSTLNAAIEAGFYEDAMEIAGEIDERSNATVSPENQVRLISRQAEETERSAYSYMTSLLAGKNVPKAQIFLKQNPNIYKEYLAQRVGEEPLDASNYLESYNFLADVDTALLHSAILGRIQNFLQGKGSLDDIKLALAWSKLPEASSAPFETKFLEALISYARTRPNGQTGQVAGTLTVATLFEMVRNVDTTLDTFYAFTATLSEQAAACSFLNTDTTIGALVKELEAEKEKSIRYMEESKSQLYTSKDLEVHHDSDYLLDHIEAPAAVLTPGALADNYATFQQKLFVFKHYYNLLVKLDNTIAEATVVNQSRTNDGHKTNLFLTEYLERAKSPRLEDTQPDQDDIGLTEQDYIGLKLAQDLTEKAMALSDFVDSALESYISKQGSADEKKLLAEFRGITANVRVHQEKVVKAPQPTTPVPIEEEPKVQYTVLNTVSTKVLSLFSYTAKVMGKTTSEKAEAYPPIPAARNADTCGL